MASLDDAVRRAQPGRPTLAPASTFWPRLKAIMLGLTLLGLLWALLTAPWT